MKSCVKIIGMACLMGAMFSSSLKGQTLGKRGVAAIQLRTNTLYDMAACPNMGVEIQTDHGIAWQLDYIGAWWNSDARHHYWSNYAFQTELRYYLTPAEPEQPFVGHHLGIYGQLATYDFEFGGTGYMCRDLDRSFGIGVSYGYSFPLNRKLSLDMTLGLGFFGSRYDVYEPYLQDYMQTDKRHFTYWGPTKLEVSLVWNLNKENNKGGRYTARPKSYRP